MDEFEINKIREKPCNIIIFEENTEILKNILYLIRDVSKMYAITKCEWGFDLGLKYYNLNANKNIKRELRNILEEKDRCIVIFDNVINKLITNSVYYKILEKSNTYCIIKSANSFDKGYGVEKEFDYIFINLMNNEYKKYKYCKITGDFIKNDNSLKKLEEYRKCCSEYNQYKYGFHRRYYKNLVIDVKMDYKLSIYAFLIYLIKFKMGDPDYPPYYKSMAKLTNEQKNELIEKVNHPSRLLYYLEKGYEVDDIFC
jgi:hypothetical protein